MSLRTRIYKHIQYNYIGVTTFRDFFLNYYFFKNLHRITNIEPRCICFNKIVAWTSI